MKNTIVISKRDHRALSTYLFKAYHKEYADGTNTCNFFTVPRTEDPGINPDPLLRTVNNFLLDEGYPPHTLVTFAMQPEQNNELP